MMDGSVLTKKALELSVVEKVHLIDALWSSLDSSEQKEIDRAWVQESQIRLNAYYAGDLAATDGEDVLATVKASLRVHDL
jgi:putative addiction module component (TIGR02574 family)